jgi:hypothetical protein
LWALLAILAETIFYALHPGNYEFQFRSDRFWVLLVISLIMFPIQTSWEELVFRGYLMQGISLIAPLRWIPLLLTSAAFGLMHLANEEVAAFGVGTTMVYFIGTGLFLGIVTLMDDSLELALGIHAATNIYASICVSFAESSLKTSSLFRMKSVDMGEMLAAFFVCAFVYVWVVSKKYGWNDWRLRVLGPVRRPENEKDAIATP